MNSTHNHEIICDGFRAECLPNGRFRVLIETHPQREIVPAGPNQRIDTEQITTLVGKISGKTPSKATVYAWTRRKKNPLPFHRLGGHIYYVRDEVDRWIRNQNNQ